MMSPHDKRGIERASARRTKRSRRVRYTEFPRVAIRRDPVFGWLVVVPQPARKMP